MFLISPSAVTVTGCEALDVDRHARSDDELLQQPFDLFGQL